MVCIYCAKRTEVTNSRLQRVHNAVWRRRRCLACKAIFTTHERIDLSAAFMVSSISAGPPVPFSRDKLFLSIVRACGHRDDQVQDAGALTETVIVGTAATANESLVQREALAKKIYEVLLNFDDAAATHYRAYHPIVTS